MTYDMKKILDIVLHRAT